MLVLMLTANKPLSGVTHHRPLVVSCDAFQSHAVKIEFLIIKCKNTFIMLLLLMRMKMMMGILFFEWSTATEFIRKFFEIFFRPLGSKMVATFISVKLLTS